MQIKYDSIMVENLDHALTFYTTILGFQVKDDVPVGTFRWITLTSPDGVPGAEIWFQNITLFPPAAVYQKALFDAGMPATGFITADIQGEYLRLKVKGVVFRGEPVAKGPITAVLFEDTCGNLINLVQPGA